MSEMQRVVVAGIAGAGKSTLALQLSDVLHLPYTEVDGLVEGPNWTRLPDFRERTIALAATDRWIVDSLWWREVEDVLLDRADTVIWLDLPRRVLVPRLLKRTFHRLKPRRIPLHNGNTERLRQLLLPTHPLQMAIAKHRPYRARLERLLADVPAQVVRLRSEDEVVAWVTDLRARSAQGS